MEVSLRESFLTLSSALDIGRPAHLLHHKQTAYLSYVLGKELGLPSDQKTAGFLSSLIHDVGLLSGEEEEVEELYKPTTLRVYRHAILGYLLLEGCDWLPKSLSSLPQIILHHHTKWREANEPQTNPILQAIIASTGEEIPLASYVVHLAELVLLLLMPGELVLDQVNRVKEKLKELSNSFFPPNVVDAFMSISNKEHFWLDLVSPYIEQYLYEIASSLVHLRSREGVKRLAEFFCSCVDFKSSFTAVHSRGVAVVARELAKLFSFPQEEVEMIEIAGYFHDLGKLAIPREILEKPGKLSEKELNWMKTHPYYTHIVLSKGLKKVERKASLHHERLDGSGYPFHLKGEEIPLDARIMAVADVFSALRESRPYRPVLDKASIFKVLEEEVKAGKLDPEVVSCLLKHYDEIDAKSQEVRLTAMAEYQRFWERFSHILTLEIQKRL